MKLWSAVVGLALAVVTRAQSFSVVLDGEVPFVTVPNMGSGRLANFRIDVFRDPLSWQRYYNAQMGINGPLFTHFEPVDWCREQLIAVNLGKGNFARQVDVSRVRILDDAAWEVQVEVENPGQAPADAPTFLNPYTVIKTPFGPNEYRFKVYSPEGRETFDVRAPYPVLHGRPCGDICHKCHRCGRCHDHERWYPW